MSKIIPNTNERYSITIDGDVYDNIKQRKLKQSQNNHGYYIVHLVMNGLNRMKLTHRLIAQAFLEEYNDNLYVDHISNDRSDNRLENLRMVSKSQNNMNRLKSYNTTSKFKGVSYYKQTGKWEAYIKFQGKRMRLGYYDNEQDAGRAYNDKAILLFGQYAKLNVI